VKAWLLFFYGIGVAFVASLLMFFGLVGVAWHDSKNEKFVSWRWKGE